MRVLNIWDTAGIASILAKYIHKLYNIETKVINRTNFNPYNIPLYGDAYNESAKRFILRSVLLAKKYDIIHIHDLDIIIPLFKLYRKPIIIHYHGTSIRNKWKERVKFWSKADAIIVSTKDLLEDAPNDTIYLPNPVDTEYFSYKGSRVNGTAFHILYNADNEAKSIAREFNLVLTVHDRKKEPINYLEMPYILSKYEYYIDIKKVLIVRLLKVLVKLH